MKSFSWVVIVLVLLPASVRAQSTKLADIVGIWVGSRTDSTEHPIADSTGTVIEEYFVMNSDSTWRWGCCLSGGGGRGRLHSLHGDTISLAGGPGYKVTLKDQRLLLVSLGSDTKTSYAFKRYAVPASEP